jgi:hypothetical protein
MTTAFSLVFIFAFLGFFSTIQAYPTGLYARQGEHPHSIVRGG